MSRKHYRLELVYTLTIQGKPAESVFTSILGACKRAGIQYQTAIKHRDAGSDRITYINTKGIRTEIVRADIVRQSKGQKKPFPKTINE